MEDFQIKTLAMIYQVMEKPPEEPFFSAEFDEFAKHHKQILTDISCVAVRELEAYLAINSCKNYDQLAKLIMRREGKNLKKSEYDKLLGRLRTRAHRGRKKMIEKLSKIYDVDN